MFPDSNTNDRREHQTQTFDRRQFLGMMAAGLGTAPFFQRNPHLPVPSKKRKWGIITNTVRNEMKADYRGTLKKLAEMGYSYIEGRPAGDSIREYRKLLKNLGLKAVIGGAGLKQLLEKPEEVIRLGHEMQYKYITCYWPWLSDAKNLSKTECLEAAERLNTIGRKMKKEGLRFTWHNHDKEFVDIEGKTPFDWLMENTDPEWVNAQMDLYWVFKGGYHPVELIKKYPGRIKLLHVKDMDTTEEKAITCVGSGRIDFREIFQFWKLAGVDYATVEHEKSTQGIPCAQTSIDHLLSIS